MRTPASVFLIGKSLSQTIQKICVCCSVCFSCSATVFAPHVAVREVGDKAEPWAKVGMLDFSRGNGAMSACFLNTLFPPGSRYLVNLFSFWVVESGGGVGGKEGEI